MQKIIVTGLLILILLTGCEKKQGAIAEQAPLTDLDGAEPSRYLEGKEYDLVVVNYFATYCAPCKKEMPDLERISGEFGTRGVLVVGVTVEPKEMKSLIAKIARLLHVSYPILYNSATRFNGDPISVVPVTYLLNRNGTVLKKYVGLLTYDELDSFLTEYQKRTATTYQLPGKTAQKRYQIRVHSEKGETALIFEGAGTYILGGAGYPPITVTINEPAALRGTYLLPYDAAGGYVIHFTGHIKKTDIKGQLKATACSDTECIQINEEFLVKITDDQNEQTL